MNESNFTESAATDNFDQIKIRLPNSKFTDFVHKRPCPFDKIDNMALTLDLTTTELIVEQLNNVDFYKVFF